MDPMDLILIIMGIVFAVIFGFYMLNRWASKKMVNNEEMIERSKVATTIYVIDKKKEKPTASNLPKAVFNQLPKYYRFLKIPLVKAKVGPQIVTLMCDKKVFAALPVKKNAKVEVAGIYIVSMKGMKTDAELKEMKKIKKEKQKALKAAK